MLTRTVVFALNESSNEICCFYICMTLYAYFFLPQTLHNLKQPPQSKLPSSHTGNSIAPCIPPIPYLSLSSPPIFPPIKIPLLYGCDQRHTIPPSLPCKRILLLPPTTLCLLIRPFLAHCLPRDGGPVIYRCRC